MIVSIITAVSENMVIGKDNDLVWDLPDDMKFFQDTTHGHHIIMGRKNYESIPAKWQPLPDRTNIVISRQEGLAIEGCIVLHSIEGGVEFARKSGESEVFIIGGGQIYEQSLHLVDRIYYTEVHAEFEGDTFFPDVDFTEWLEKSRIHHSKDDRHAHSFDFVIYERRA